MADGDVASRIAAAPISWGVCEVPGWGHQLDPGVVLSEIRDLGIRSIEFGPEGFLPARPSERAALLTQYGLRAIGGFVPVVLHDPLVDPLAVIEREIAAFVSAGADRLVLSADTGAVSYDSAPVLDGDQWTLLLGNLDRIDRLATDRGVVASLHPHVGTVVETPAQVARVLSGSGIGLTLDTGHYTIGGGDPAELVAAHAPRIRHVHLKDVRAAAAALVRSGKQTYTQAVAAGMYTPLGDGDIDLRRIVRDLESSGYGGWYVLEQDTILEDEPAPGDGPVKDAQRSLAFIASLAG